MVRVDSSSLGLGSLLPIVALRWMQAAGHKPVILLAEGAHGSDGPIEAHEAHWAATLARCLRFGPGPWDATVLDARRWRDGLWERGSQPGSDASLGQALDLIEVAHRFGSVVRICALDDKDDLAASLAQAHRLGAGPVAGFTTVLAKHSQLRLSDGSRCPLVVGRASTAQASQHLLSALADDVPRLVRLFTDEPLDMVRRWARGEAGGLAAARRALAASVTRMFDAEHARDADEAGLQFREVA
jgi:tyrosyl-tRNA synthetase